MYSNPGAQQGQFLEEIINMTNEKYREQGLALVSKIPTPITPVEMQGEGNRITLAYFDRKSTVDYVGVVQGIPICFDAKECAIERFSISNNLHEHQMEYMEDFEKQNGIAFLLMHFRHVDKYVYVPYKDLKRFWDRMKSGGQKNFKYSELDPKYEIQIRSGVFLHYLEQIQMDLNER